MKRLVLSQAQWYIPLIPFGRQRQEDYEFKGSLGYIATATKETSL
jgi:hypothetical protein